MLLLATRSAGKLRELRPMFAARGVPVVDLAERGVAESPAEDALEAHPTFEENALAKARYFFGLTGCPTVADDSGLCVAALGGRPGVASKRWSGRTDLTGAALDAENNRLLMESLRAVEMSPGSGRAAGAGAARDRLARFVCVAAYVDDVCAVVCRGEVHGRIVDAPRGTGGFGYDPYFAVDELDGRTFGEASDDEKARVSHRARAFARLLAELIL